MRLFSKFAFRGREFVAVFQRKAFIFGGIFKDHRSAGGVAMGADARTTGPSGNVLSGNYDKIAQVTDNIVMGATGNMTVYAEIKVRVEEAVRARKIPDVYPNTVEGVSEMVRVLIHDEMKETLGHFVEEIENLMDDADKDAHNKEFEKQIDIHSMEILVASWFRVMKVSLDPIIPDLKWNYGAAYVPEHIVCLGTGESHMWSFIHGDVDSFREERTGDQSVDSVIKAIKHAFKRDWSTGGKIHVKFAAPSVRRSVTLEPLTEFCDSDFKVIEDTLTTIT